MAQSHAGGVRCSTAPIRSCRRRSACGVATPPRRIGAISADEGFGLLK
jgi:hypothetical protein